MPNASRALDLAVAVVVLAVASPVILIAAVAIRLESGGPVLYRQRRVGRHGEPFELWKLRTMVPKAETMGAGVYVLEGDPRITRVGRRLRRFSLDELPNLINVLKGDMAVVGPRPTVQEQVDRYTDRQLRRLEVKPGITGWAQVNGRTSLPWPVISMRAVRARMRRSRASERLSTYQTSSSIRSGQESEVRPLTWAQPVMPGLTSSRRSWRSV